MTSVSETWKAVPGFEGFYEASNAGQVRNVAKRKRTLPGRLLKGSISDKGRTLLKLYKPGQPPVGMSRAHVVALAFLGVPPEGKDWVNHKDGDQTNDSVENLEWTTPAENHQHAMRTGLRADGEKSPHAKLTVKDVEEIEQLFGKMQCKDIAKKFGVTKATISRIKNKRNWKYRIKKHV